MEVNVQKNEKRELGGPKMNDQCKYTRKKRVFDRQKDFDELAERSFQAFPEDSDLPCDPYLYASIIEKNEN
jgi:hypothetical protein